MSLSIGDNFSYLGRKPLDTRLYYETLVDMATVPDACLYEGIMAYNKETALYYMFDPSNVNNAVTGKWREFKASGSSTSNAAEVLEYKENTKYDANILVFLKDKICRTEVSFTSSNTGNIEDSFEDDIKAQKLSVINTDHAEVINPYEQGNFYQKNTLVYNENLIMRVLNNFISNNTETTVEDSVNADIAANNLVVINKEAEPGILPYKQGTFFSKDKLVFADGRIGRVLKDYISDATGATLEESINIDIHNGDLREMAENYKFKLYKTTQDMDKTIDAINTLPLSTIQFENGENIGNMQLNEGIYGPLGTLAIIQEIDKNTNTIKAKTVNSREMEFMPPAPNSYNFQVILGGSGYSVGEVINTSIPNVLAEIDQIEIGGAVKHVILSDETISQANGVGAYVEAETVYFVGNGKQWYELNQDNAVTIVEYKQGETYKKDSLIFLNDILARAIKDFISNSTESTIDKSFKVDLDSGNIARMTREDVSVPECLGSVKTDKPEDLPTTAIKGNWVLIEECVKAAPGQAGIGLYNGTSWDINPIPQGTFQFPEPNDDGKLNFRKRTSGSANGSWEPFTSVNGNDIELTIKQLADSVDGPKVPKAGELVYDTERKILVIGDGTTNLAGLEAFYGEKVTNADILSALGFTPEDSSKKGQANGYAPLGADGLVPTAHLPKALTDVYTKAETDKKDTDTLNSVTTLVNNEATRAQKVEAGLRTDLNTHVNNKVIHVTQTEKDTWNAKVEKTDLAKYDNHLADTAIHVTQKDKDKWNGMQKAYYVTDVKDLPTTDNQVGNTGYVQVSAAGVSPVVCDQYIWDGTAWKQLDAGQVSLSFKWDNLQGKPSSTPLIIDNAVTVAHSHTNKNVLDKIGQSAAGNFTYDGVEIGVRVVFLANENLLPPLGTEDTLYVIYDDSRVRHYPSISVYKNGSYQVLGRGTQDAPPVVGDMSILQNEYFSVQPDSSYNIHTTPNQYFAFMPVEILKEIEGLKDQKRVVVDGSKTADFDYNENIISVDQNHKIKINMKEIPAVLDTVSSFYYFHADVDLSDYKDIDSIE